MKKDPKVSTAISFKIYKLFNGLIFFNYYEYIWRGFCVFFTLIGAMLVKKLADLLGDPEYRKVHVGSISDCYIVFPVVIIIWTFREVFTYLMRDHMAQYLDPNTYKTKEDIKSRSETLCKFALDFTYYSGTTIAAYIIMKDSKCLPSFMLGSGDINLADPNLPDIDLVPYGKELYLVQMGHHLYSCLYQIAKKRKDKKFFEFLLHHIMAFLLIFFSYSINIVNSGVLVLLCHDISDAFLVLCRGYGDYVKKNKKVVNVLFVLGFATWIYSRLYAFPKCFIIPKFLHFGEYREEYRSTISFVMGYLISMTSMLFLMHIYWSIFMVKALFYSSVKNKVKVEYDLKDMNGNSTKRQNVSK